MKIYDHVSTITLYINEEEKKLVVRPADTLLRVLREKVGLTGSKPGCENGDCGGCTILLRGNPVKSCMILAVEVDGENITTIEGLKNTAIQKSFLEEGGFQCGYCTPGFLINAYALLEAHPDADDETCKDWLQSNICRCTGYEGIRKSIKAAQKIIMNKS